GYEQARWLAEYLQTAPIGMIYSSDSLRARQTAEIIAQSRTQPLQVQTSMAWRELDFGAWEGLTYAQIVERFPHQLAFFTDPLHASPPDGEAFSALLQRVQVAFLSIVQASVDQTTQHGDIVLVSHGGPLRALLCCILK